MTGIRNPSAHESQLVDTPESALEMIVLANHLGCMVKLPVIPNPATRHSGESRNLRLPGSVTVAVNYDSGFRLSPE